MNYPKERLVENDVIEVLIPVKGIVKKISYTEYEGSLELKEKLVFYPFPDQRYDLPDTCNYLYSGFLEKEIE